MTSKVKGLIEEGNTRALETWLTNTKQTIKGQTSLKSLVSAKDDLARILLPADLEIVGRSVGAMVLGKLPVPGRPTYLDRSRARTHCSCSRCG